MGGVNGHPDVVDDEIIFLPEISATTWPTLLFETDSGCVAS